jgi:hypothetical protein
MLQQSDSPPSSCSQLFITMNPCQICKIHLAEGAIFGSTCASNAYVGYRATDRIRLRLLTHSGLAPNSMSPVLSGMLPELGPVLEVSQ